MTIETPRWWWPHDHGEPFLYEYAVTVKVDGQPVDTHQGRAGIRTVTLEQAPLADGGTSFCFLVNGARVFLKGISPIRSNPNLPWRPYGKPMHTSDAESKQLRKVLAIAGFQHHNSRCPREHGPTRWPLCGESANGCAGSPLTFLRLRC
jgi:hypothetical protein